MQTKPHPNAVAIGGMIYWQNHVVNGFLMQAYGGHNMIMDPYRYILWGFFNIGFLFVSLFLATNDNVLSLIWILMIDFTVI